MVVVKIGARRQVTLPAHVLEVLGVKPGDRIGLAETAEGYVLRPRLIDCSQLARLRGKSRRGRGTFGIAACRERLQDRESRD